MDVRRNGRRNNQQRHPTARREPRRRVTQAKRTAPSNRALASDHVQHQGRYKYSERRCKYRAKDDV
jgi:hypothetical protein